MPRSVNRKSIFLLVAAALVVTVALYDVSIAVEFALPGEKTVVDAKQEARYEACYAAKDEVIHETAFGTIDNPDVQKEYIASNRARAAHECRLEFPERSKAEKTRFRFNLVDLEPRFW